MKQCFLFLCALLLATSLCAQHDIHVSPHGQDSNNGSLSAPLQTLSAALRQVRNAPVTEVRIQLSAGSYPLEKTLLINPEVLNGHTLTIQAYMGAQVTIHGLSPIRAKWQPWQQGVLKAHIGKGLMLDQLYCNGVPLPMARYPNADSTQHIFYGTAADAISPERVQRWQSPAGGYVHALHQGMWGGFHYLITGKDPQGQLQLEGGWQNNRPAPMHAQYRFVENILEELDAPGEWYYDTVRGILYIYPPQGVNMQQAVFARSVIDDLVHITGTTTSPVSSVTVRGIRFTGTNRTFMHTREPLLRSDWTIYRGGAILISGGRHIRISDCDFGYLGGNALFVSGYNRDVQLSGNHIQYIGGTAIAFVGDSSAVRSPLYRYADTLALSRLDIVPGPVNDRYPDSCAATDNLIHHIGTIEKQVAGVQISMARRIRVQHNSIYQVPRAGINIGDGCWGGHDIGFNDVFNTVLETSDHGAFNSWGRDRYWVPDIHATDERVARNPDLPLLDAVDPVLLHDNRFQCAHGWDIDLDDGSSNYRIYNNVCLQGGLKLREGYGRTVWNNILVNSTFHPHVWYLHSGDVFRHNIVGGSYAPIRLRSWGTTVDSNLLPTAVAVAAAQKNGTDKHSLAGDPDFSDPSGGDYQVKAGSPAFRIGFVNFAMRDLGVRSARLKALAQSPSLPPIRAIVAATSGDTLQWLGARLKNITTLGERSAAGLYDQEGALVLQVSPGSLAAKSGLKAGDVIRKVNGQSIRDLLGLQELIKSLSWQLSTDLLLIRDQQERRLDLPLR
ncbi:PDZ domain-containing protein [Chitinophaga pendula]|uniref:PDZ domain-containing protein n=1 Tax=Chitinophaga TaxID=79328 RepID=UPI000BAF604C|nr:MULTISPECIES: PDZ domain-containing protein [Chitinophaga]ASZ13815.1 peptide-binding protein [Chitinophaga sp. MD30]UCJ08564.1 PDZ domain-containing protein [Chitinophaga pendula]